MYILNIVSAIRKMSVNKIRNSIFENYHKRIGFFEENSHYLVKSLKKKICCS